MADTLSERIKLCPELRHSMHFVRQMKEKEHRTIAMYLIVRALDPGIPRTQRDMSKAIRSLMTALNAYTAREPTDFGIVKIKDFKSYSILDVYRQRVVNTVAAVILGVENSVATRNMDRQHYSVNAHQIAILYPLVHEYCKHNLLYKLKAYPTLWGSNAQAMKPGSWTAYNEKLTTGAPFLYVVCIHLYYIIFDGGRYGTGNLSRKCKEYLKIHPFSQLIYGAESIGTFWTNHYCNPEGTVSNSIQYPYNMGRVMIEANALEWKYQKFMTLNDSTLDTFTLVYADERLCRPTGYHVLSKTFTRWDPCRTPLNTSCLTVVARVTGFADTHAIYAILNYTTREYNVRKPGDLLESIVNRMIQESKTVAVQMQTEVISFRPLMDDGLLDFVKESFELTNLKLQPYENQTIIKYTFQANNSGIITFHSPLMMPSGDVQWSVEVIKNNNLDEGADGNKANYYALYTWTDLTWSYNDTPWEFVRSNHYYTVALQQLMVAVIMKHTEALTLDNGYLIYYETYALTGRSRHFEFTAKQLEKTCLQYVDAVFTEKRPFKIDGFYDWLNAAQTILKNGTIFPNAVREEPAEQSNNVPLYLMNPALYALQDDLEEQAKTDVDTNIRANVDSTLPLGAPYETVAVAPVEIKDLTEKIDTVLATLFWDKFKIAEPV